MRAGRVLVYGYGNISRMDDALGVSFTERLEKWVSLSKKSNISFEVNYQLEIEDSLLISDYDAVIFADASRFGDAFELKKIEFDETANMSFSNHILTPENIVNLCGKLYGKFPESYVLTIKGYSWDMVEKLSRHAEQNLEQALSFMKNRLQII